MYTSSHVHAGLSARDVIFPLLFVRMTLPWLLGMIIKPRGPRRPFHAKPALLAAIPGVVSAEIFCAFIAEFSSA
jgi:hypothetical protein